MRTRIAGLIATLTVLPGFAAGPVEVGPPSVPEATPAVRDLPDAAPDPNLFGLEAKKREEYGFQPIVYPVKPQVDPLLAFQERFADLGPTIDAFHTPLKNFPGQTSSTSPPDAVGDVGIDHYVQSINLGVSTAVVYSKDTGQALKTFSLQSLATSSPCNSGFCDSVTLYDRAADRWLISELPSSGGSVCVYVSQSPDPMGTWYAYTFAIETSTADYPKYGVWPQNGNGGSYLIGVNAGASGVRDVIALDRAKMLAGLPATFQKFTVPRLPNYGFQLVLPATLQGSTPPPDGEPAIVMRPRDDESQDGASTPAADTLEMWALSVDWATPANSSLTPLPAMDIADFDGTLCGTGSNWACMPQPGTTQKIDPIREPLHFPLQYRNFGTYQALVGAFATDVDGTDRAAMRWFEMRKSGGSWTLHQEGVVGGEAGIHRSVGSIAIDQSGNIALGYTRTGGTAPYYPSIYYRGRLASDPPGTMPQGEYVIQDATTSKTGNERWGDYASMGVDPVDDCTFWFTHEYGGQGNTRIAAFKFDACGCLSVPPAPANPAASAPSSNRIDVAWSDSSFASITEYQVFRSTSAGGPYTLLAAVSDSSPGVAGGPSYTYHDDTVSGGTRYYYVVRATDGGACISPNSAEVSALATGECRLAPLFGGLASVTNAGASTCTLDLAWPAATSSCGNAVTYDIFRSTSSGFTPDPANRIVSGVTGTAFRNAIDLGYGIPYHYVVRAVDAGNGLSETNTVRRSGTPTGPFTLSGWTDTFEGSLSGGGFDQVGWTHAPLSGSVDWSWSTAQKRDGLHSWFGAEQTTPQDRVLVSPSFGVGPSTTLSFWHTYAFESSSTCYDAGTLEVSTDGGSTWTVVPDAAFVAGGFNGTVNTGYSNPIGGKRAWCHGTIGPMTQVQVNLGAVPSFLDKTVRVRWHQGDDNGTTVTGWYVDSVTVSNAQVSSTCTMGVGTLVVANDGPACAGGTLNLSATYQEGGVGFSWTGPNGFSSSLQNPSIPGVTPAAAGTYTVTVLSGATPVTSGSTTAAVASAAPAAATGVSLSGSTLSWDPAADAASWDVVRGRVSALASGFGAATDACEANDLASTSLAVTHVPPAGEGDWYLVRGRNACGQGTYDDGTQAAPRDAGLSGAAGACP